MVHSRTAQTTFRFVPFLAPSAAGARSVGPNARVTGARVVRRAESGTASLARAHVWRRKAVASLTCEAVQLNSPLGLRSSSCVGMNDQPLYSGSMDNGRAQSRAGGDVGAPAERIRALPRPGSAASRGSLLPTLPPLPMGTVSEDKYLTLEARRSARCTAARAPRARIAWRARRCALTDTQTGCCRVRSRRRSTCG